MKIINNNPLYFAFFIPAVVDGILTLVAQGPEYWSSIRKVNEASPAYYFLLHSPGLYLLGAFVWFLFWYFIFFRLKKPFNLIIAIFFIVGHSWGGGGWIMRLFWEHGVYTLTDQSSIISAWGMLMVYFLLVAVVGAYCLNIYFTKNRN